MTLTRVPACIVKGCPAPRDPDWHRCFVCKSDTIEHHHVRPRGMGGSKARSGPENVVALCHREHEAVTTHECSDRILDLPGKGRTYVYYDVRGKVLCERVLEGEGDGDGIRQAGEEAAEVPERERAAQVARPDGGQRHSERRDHKRRGSPVSDVQPDTHHGGIQELEAGSAAAVRAEEESALAESSDAVNVAAAPPASGEGEEALGGRRKNQLGYSAEATQGRSTQHPSGSAVEMGSRARDEEGGVDDNHIRTPAGSSRHGEPAELPYLQSGVAEQIEAQSSAAEPPVRGALPGPAGDSRLVPSPSAAPPSVFDLSSWKKQGEGLLEMEETIWSAAQAIQFAKGDWFLDGEQHLAEEVYGHLDAIHSPSGKTFNSGTLMQYIWVAKNVAPDTRVLELDWSYHRAVAALPAPKQKEWLDKARDENLTTRQLHQAIHGKKPKVKRWTLEELRELAKEHWELVKSGPNAREAEGGEQFLDWLEAK